MYSKLEIQEVLGSSIFTMRLADNSSYNPSAGSNAILEITPPGAPCAVIFNVTKGFNTSYDANSLEIAPNNTYTETTTIPDGVYKIKYSIAPNESVYVEYYLFRNNILLNKIAEATCKLFGERKNIGTREFESRLRQLYWLKYLADSSKLVCEYQGQYPPAIELYNEAYSLVENYNNVPCH